MGTKNLTSANNSRRLHHSAALLTGSPFFRIVEPFHQRWKLLHDIRELKIFLVQLVRAILAVPHEPVVLSVASVTLYHQATRIRSALG